MSGAAATFPNVSTDADNCMRSELVAVNNDDAKLDSGTGTPLDEEILSDDSKQWEADIETSQNKRGATIEMQNSMGPEIVTGNSYTNAASASDTSQNATIDAKSIESERSKQSKILIATSRKENVSIVVQNTVGVGPAIDSENGGETETSLHDSDDSMETENFDGDGKVNEGNEIKSPVYELTNSGDLMQTEIIVGNSDRASDAPQNVAMDLEESKQSEADTATSQKQNVSTIEVHNSMGPAIAAENGGAKSASGPETPLQDLVVSIQLKNIDGNSEASEDNEIESPVYELNDSGVPMQLEVDGNGDTNSARGSEAPQNASMDSDDSKHSEPVISSSRIENVFIKVHKFIGPEIVAGNGHPKSASKTKSPLDKVIDFDVSMQLENIAGNDDAESKDDAIHSNNEAEREDDSNVVKTASGIDTLKNVSIEYESSEDEDDKMQNSSNDWEPRSEDGSRVASPAHDESEEEEESESEKERLPEDTAGPSHGCSQRLPTAVCSFDDDDSMESLDASALIESIESSEGSDDDLEDCPSKVYEDARFY